MKSLVSIIVPCYNQVQYLDECLQSILDQSYENWECIIVNDGSLDDSEEIAHKWVKNDSRFKYIYKENGGVSSARNLGLDNCTGDYIQFLDGDDILENNKIEISITKLKADNLDFIITDFKTFSNDKQNAQLHPDFINPAFFTFKGVLSEWGRNFNIPIHCGFFKKNLFQYFRFSTKLKGNEDWLMWVFLFKTNVKVGFINEPLTLYRYHSTSATKNEQKMLESYEEAVVCMSEFLSKEEYINSLICIVHAKEKNILKLENKIKTYQNTTSFKILKKMKTNKYLVSAYNFVFQIFKKD